MLNVETISSILDDFGDTPVSVQVEHCLNKRHKGAGCRRCVDTCPTQAINLQMGRPWLDAGHCVNCGLCLHTCPTDVFTQQNRPEVNLTQTVSLLSDDTLALVCPQHDTPSATCAPVSAVVRHKRCLASLSAAQLIELSLVLERSEGDGGRRAIWLDDSLCTQCPIGRAQPVISQVAETTNYLLQAFGQPSAIRTHLSNQDELHSQPAVQPLVDGDQPAVSRRGFFSTLGRLARRTAATMIGDVLPALDIDEPVPVGERLPHRIPTSRARLFSQLTRLGTPPEGSVETAGLPFADVIVDGSACSACRLCARFCPTGALSFAADAESFVLYFKPAICIDCGICAAACPEDAVSFGSQTVAAALIETQRQRLVAGSLTACVGCGELTVSRSNVAGRPAEGPRCYVCRHGADPMAPLKDTAALIADLVKRLPDTDASEDSHERGGG